MGTMGYDVALMRGLSVLAVDMHTQLMVVSLLHSQKVATRQRCSTYDNLARM
jgi:hypothetical protein